MKYILQILFLLAIFPIATHGMRATTPPLVRDEWTVMGTIAGLSLRGEGNLDLLRTTIQDVYRRQEELLSAWDPSSELSRLAAAGETNWAVSASVEVRDCYRTALLLTQRSSGAFNPAVGTVLRDLGVAMGGHYAAFDLGAIAKGFAVDAAATAVERTFPRGQSPDLLIDLGGNLRVVGTGSWRTGIRDPFSQGYAGIITLTNGESVATSGNYERFIEQDGRRLSHILDGRTGIPVEGLAGVTVITSRAEGAGLADGLSTTLFVLGPQEGTAFLKRWHPHLAVLWIPDTPSAPRILASPAMAARLTCAVYPVEIVR